MVKSALILTPTSLVSQWKEELKEFMTRGDPTDPRNRSRLKTLLGEVMIRNTRALAKIGLPPRFAHTIRVDPSRSEKELYERVTGLVQSIKATDGTGRKLLLKNLLAEAGRYRSKFGINLFGQFRFTFAGENGKCGLRIGTVCRMSSSI